MVLQHCARQDKRDNEAFNIACDIVVNSNILLENKMDVKSITLKKYGESMHLTPSGKEGYYHTAEEVYEMLPQNFKKQRKKAEGGIAEGRARHKNADRNGNPRGVWDDHSRWGMYEKDDTLRDVWVKRFEDAAEAISVRDPSNSRGLFPMFAKRMLEELHKAQTDWRTILNDFIQEEICDYSFSPPDRRFDDSPFFLPDFNGKDEKVEDILFMIDTSGSMSDKMITAAYSEVKGAIDQFDGKLRGWLGFFDAAIVEPKEFSSEEEFRIIRPAGGGGTDFQIIFEYVATRMSKTPASIIILTDGFCPFPQEKLAMGIPVLWLINNEAVDPPWGKVARIKI
jgi:predicted metal-dependent peptidase